MTRREQGYVLESHPRESDLALLASDDLPIWRRISVAHHVQRCAECEREVEELQAASAQIKRGAASETLTAFEAVGDWPALEREMIGNIKVGLAAAQCIDSVGSRRFPRWGAAALVACLSIVFVAGWFLHVPMADTRHVLSALHLAFAGPRTINGTVLQTTPEGVAVRSQGAILTVMHPASAHVILSVSGNSSVGARYFDDETGQVTITSVYGQ
jgi:hypothetical protein